MLKFKVTADVVNRGGKSYAATDGVIEVLQEDAQHFEGFEEVKPKKTKDEDNK